MSKQINLLQMEAKRMKIQTSKLMPNPYRNMPKYKLQPERVQSLINSIRDTSFWDNILARPNPDGSDTFEIAYGHHRLEAVKTIGIKMVDIPVKELTDALMVKIMANENMSDWHMDTNILVDTVWAVQDFILDSVEKRKNLPLSKKAITHIKNSKAVGKAVLIDFLGKGWEGKIQTALALRKDEKERPDIVEAARTIDTPSTAKGFAKAIKDYNIPKEEVKPLARRVKKEKMSAREAVSTVRRNRPKPVAPGVRDRLMKEAEEAMGDVSEKTMHLYNAMYKASRKLEALKVEEISGLQAALDMERFNKLMREFRKYLKFFGFNDRDMLTEGGK